MNNIIALMVVTLMLFGVGTVLANGGTFAPDDGDTFVPDDPDDNGDTFVPEEPDEPDKPGCGVVSPGSLIEWSICNPQGPDDDGDNGNGEEGATIKSSRAVPGAWFTRYGWNGEECVKRDLVTKPRGTKHTSFNNPNLKPFTLDGENFVYRLILGKRAFAWEPNPEGFGKRIRERDKTCDETIIETNPLPVTWWRNSHNQSQYIQFVPA